MQVRILKTNGRSESAEVATFEGLRKLVGGHVKIVTLNLNDGHPTECAINEDGPMVGLPANPHVSISYDHSAIPDHAIVIGEALPHICGDIVMLPADWGSELVKENA
jgi:hypothetical protein